MLGIAAATGVFLYFTGALAAHLGAHDRNFIPPLTLGGLAAAALVLRILSN